MEIGERSPFPHFLRSGNRWIDPVMSRTRRIEKLASGGAGRSPQSEFHRRIARFTQQDRQGGNSRILA